jgi:hypothetical protein
VTLIAAAGLQAFSERIEEAAEHYILAEPLDPRESKDRPHSCEQPSEPREEDNPAPRDDDENMKRIDEEDTVCPPSPDADRLRSLSVSLPGRGSRMAGEAWTSSSFTAQEKTRRWPQTGIEKSAVSRDCATGCE